MDAWNSDLVDPKWGAPQQKKAAKQAGKGKKEKKAEK